MTTVRLPSRDFLGGRRDLVHCDDQRVEVVLDRVEIAMVGVGDLGGGSRPCRSDPHSWQTHSRADHGIQNGVHAAHDLGVCATDLVRLVRARSSLPCFREISQSHSSLLQTLQDFGHVVDGQLHLFVIALIGLGNQFVDLAVGDLRECACLPR